MKQPFTIGGSTPLKKALLEETGIELVCETVLKHTYLVPDNGKFYGEGSKYSTHYQLPQDWDKAIAAVTDFFAEEKFEKDKWYYANDGSLTQSIFKFSHIDKDDQPMFSEAINLYDDKATYFTNQKTFRNLQPATTEQIELMLGKVAESKGYVKGAKAICLLDEYKKHLDGRYFEYVEKSDSLIASTPDAMELNILIYQEGKWAELLPQEEPKSSDVKTEHVRAFVKEWMEGHEPDTFIANEHGNYVYSAGPTSINLPSFFEELLLDYIDHDPQAKEPKPETLVLKDIVLSDILSIGEDSTFEIKQYDRVDLHLTATHLQQLKAYFSK
jgi:hypothetical protein